MTNQPRNEQGQFVQIKTDEIQTLNESNTIGVCEDQHVTPAAEYVNVDIELLQEAIDKAKTDSDIIRIGLITKRGEQNGRQFEKGLVLFKGSPSDSEVVSLAGMRREWDSDTKPTE